MKRFSSHVIVDNKFLILLILVLIVNTTLVGLGYNFINNHLIYQEDEFSYKQKFARDLWDYNSQLARDLGVEDRSSVRDTLSRLIQEVEQASTGEDLAQAILAHGRRSQETILREYEARQRERVLSAVNQDENIREIRERQRISIAISLESGVDVDPPGILADETIEEIIDIIFEEDSIPDISLEIEIEEGRGKIIHTYSPLERLKELSAEVDSLRVSLREVRATAGYTEMSGSGIIINIYDADEGYSTNEIIHETDVRDIVNELFASGAKGVSVGGQRLITTSAIRCVGPVIMVNDERISVNPVVIQAIGDPQVLESGTDIIRISLISMRQLKFEIDRVDNLTLPAYSR